jgi:predicted RNA-binding Zn-ribbon protein involved in translation (DUF1610 family)
MMPSVPAYCSHCGQIFDGSGGIHISNCADIRLIGNRMTCPNCGHLARIVDGTFSETGNGLELVDGPELTRLILDHFRNIATRAQTKEITPQEAILEATQLNPKLGRLMELFIQIGLPALAVLISLVGLYLQYEGGVSTDEFEARAIQLLERQVQISQTLADSKRVSPDDSVQCQRDKRTESKDRKKSVSLRSASKRRKIVNDERRKQHAERRKLFPPRDR